MHIGIEDDSEIPESTQKVETDMPDRIVRRISELTINVGLKAEIIIVQNGGEYIELTIFPSTSSVASTNKGEYLIRNDDRSRSVLPEDLSRLYAEKSAFCWETKVVNKILWKGYGENKYLHMMRE